LPAEDQTTSHKPKLLAVLDTGASDLRWIDVELLQFETMKKLGMPIDIVTSDQSPPEQMRDYIFMNWSSHAKSDPSAWGKSFLVFNKKPISASTIAKSWNLVSQPVVTLAACETAIELSAPKVLDEYCGLDLAFRIAGARSVYATMWPVFDPLAALGSLFFPSWALKHNVTPGEALVRFQIGLRTQRWKGWCLRDDQILLEPEEVRDDLLELRNRFFTLDADAFAHPSAWAAFRCFGA
jgi:CHAT domain-containing protein